LAAVGQDADWFTREPEAVRFWADVAQINPDGFQRALAQWQAANVQFAH
jgi:hypothetical protein